MNCCPTCGHEITQPESKPALTVDLRENMAVAGYLGARLRPREAEILAVLLENAPKSVSAQYLEACVVGLTEEYRARGWTYKLICSLRKKIAPMGAKIKNIHGVGYQLQIN